MSLEINAKMLFSDTYLPDIFIKEYLPVLDGDSVRIYLYCVFLLSTSGNKTQVDTKPLPELLGISEKQFTECLTKLETFGLIIQSESVQNNHKIKLTDLKEKELLKYYRPKTSLDPQTPSVKKNATVRMNTIKHISDTFFAGQMGNSWYGEIDLWFEKYSFDDAVMVMLFSHCAQHLSKMGQSLSRGKEYVRKVAQNWFKEGIQTPDQLDQHLMEYEKYRTFRNLIVKKSNIRDLDEYQEAIIHKWYFDYKYPFEIIEQSLRKSIYIKNKSVNTFDKFITEWFNAGIRTEDAVISYEEEKKRGYQEKKGSPPDKNKIWDFENQHNYDDEFFDKLEKRAYEE